MAEVRVEVVFALPGQALLRQVTLEAGATVQDAILAAGFGEGEGVIDPQRLGIFGRRVTPQQALRDGDRVEIYRPLVLDPKDARRRRAGQR